MSSAGRHKAFGPWTGWWATAARALALVLALAISLPTAGMAEDLAYHQGHPRNDGIEMVVGSNLMSASSQKADPGVACHVHCGCHAAMPLDGLTAAPPVTLTRPCYGQAEAALSSIFPDRLPRPPRA
ncbi:hypothetical protein [Methylobacterium sp. NFXW15]|uniref:hypothetical protein n=1 Tax=Methylobacterium sp. NFXW15 TaxID=2819512 RepID=UPI003CF5B78B